MPKIPTLDLFSGIGGFAWGLRHVCCTVAYCEIDQKCQSVLHNQMSKGNLDFAPIFPDIRRLKAEDLRNLNIHPKMATSGSLCTDISIANFRGKGVVGPQSKLVFDAVELIKSIPSIEILLLENSANLKRRGESVLIKALENAGFQTRTMQLSAESIGAFHRRRRWFCFAWKNLQNMSLLRSVRHVWRLPTQRFIACNGDVAFCRQCILRCWEMRWFQHVLTPLYVCLLTQVWDRKSVLFQAKQTLT